jgi:hypothetical protein
MPQRSLYSNFPRCEMSKIRAFFFRLRYGVKPHKHIWERIAADTWACSYEETPYADIQGYKHRCSAWFGHQAWS